MLDDGLLVPITLFISFALTVTGLARIISDGRTRRRLIEAGGSADVARALAAQQDEHGLYGALKWGIVTVGVGLALVIVQFLPYAEDEPIILGVVLLFFGGGLLTYHLIAARRLAGHAGMAPEAARQAHA